MICNYWSLTSLHQALDLEIWEPGGWLGWIPGTERAQDFARAQSQPHPLAPASSPRSVPERIPGNLSLPGPPPGPAECQGYGETRRLGTSRSSAGLEMKCCNIYCEPNFLSSFPRALLSNAKLRLPLISHPEPHFKTPHEV